MVFLPCASSSLLRLSTRRVKNRPALATIFKPFDFELFDRYFRQRGSLDAAFP